MGRSISTNFIGSYSVVRNEATKGTQNENRQMDLRLGILRHHVVADFPINVLVDTDSVVLRVAVSILYFRFCRGGDAQSIDCRRHGIFPGTATRMSIEGRSNTFLKRKYVCHVDRQELTGSLRRGPIEIH